ncbi:MAG: hypothetical protein GTO02_08430 [Candidatus Dadabacteria bacterium]|nr:hypothetical protein [Candidatus Dadabacteria bacterium]NIQ14413.1 hypothetical protein [Candidatus Dadabacteria bacterium]
MKRIIRHILKEEITNSNEKRYLDEVVKRLISDIYVIDNERSTTFESITGAWEMGLFDEEADEIVHKDENFNLLGWDYYVDEKNPYDEGYYFRINKPDEHYDFNEFQMVVMYDWLGELVHTGDLISHGDSWEIVNKDKLIMSKTFDFSCPLYRNEFYKTYTMADSCFTKYKLTQIIKELNNTYGIDKNNTEQTDYIIENFYSKLYDKLNGMGIKVSEKLSPEIVNESVVDDFISFGKELLSLDDNFRVNLTDNGDDIETLANYDMESGEINVLTKDRAVPDIIRSIAHEMVHHKQNNRGDLRGTPEEGEDGSPWEDEANAKAGEIVRIFGRQYPEIYDL